MAISTTLCCVYSSVHQVTDEEIPQYADYVISKFHLKSYTFSNTALLKMKNKIDADIMTDGWPEFSCTVIKLPNSEVMLAINLFVSDSQENLEKLLQAPKFNEVSLIAVLDQKTSDYLKSVTTSWPSGFTRKEIFNYRTFHFPGTIKDLPNWSCPKGTFLDRLQVDHASFISESYKYCELQDRVQYFTYLIANCFSVGLFLEVDSSQPVSWALLSTYGHIIHIHTVEQHRRKGYSRVIMLCLMQQILEANMTPILEINIHNLPSVKLNTGLGFVESFDSAWILYT